MAKNHIKNSNKIIEIEKNRTGGQTALFGFGYQILYSCYILLTFLDNKEKSIRLEGVEDIDKYSGYLQSDKNIEHIQLKQSQNKQDASFLRNVLKNFLEVYLQDKTRHFKLVYDLDVSDGNLKKIINQKLDKSSYEYWQNVINQIKEEKPDWNWDDFDIRVFFSHLSFENLKKHDLALEIEKHLINNFEITLGNERLFVHGLHVLCFDKMQNREFVTREVLLRKIQEIKDDISRGPHNPAVFWFNRIDFDGLSKIETPETLDYYDGKKAEPIDIVRGLPVRRLEIEEEIAESIEKNNITIIKSSSGQGKTTLALQTAYNIRNEYCIYKLDCCDDNSQLANIVEYIHSRIKVGEVPLILLDNLDAKLKEWNKLAQLLSEKLVINYKLLVTTREDDWKLYSGPQENLKSLKTIDIELKQAEAEMIYLNLKKQGKIHASVQYWQTCWEKVSARKLLIEYIYLLTHGQMLEERIDEQVKNLQDKDGKIKCELLRQICLADVLGVNLPVKALFSTFENSTDKDFSMIIDSLEKEFYITFREENIYIQGLHPIRSEHIVKKLHQYIDIKETLLKLLEIVDGKYAAKLYSVFPKYVKNDKDKFYKNLVQISQDKSYKFLLNALNGLFSGCVDNYFQENREIFDDVVNHSGLVLFNSETNPFGVFPEVNEEIRVLSSLCDTMPENENIKHLYGLSKQIPTFDRNNCDCSFYAEHLYNYLKDNYDFEDKDISTELASWMINYNSEFNLIRDLSFDEIWRNRYEYGINNISELMYCWFLTDKTSCFNFIQKNKTLILGFLKETTNSLKIYENKNDIHIEYVLLPEQINSANDMSVNRLKTICKTMPIYETYCSNSIKPKLEFLQGINCPDDSHKEMPIRNIVIGFHHNFSRIWDDTISSNYESSSIYEWLTYWYKTRTLICEFIESYIEILEKKMNKKSKSEEFNQKFIDTCKEIKGRVNVELFFTHEKSPHREKEHIPEEAKNFKNSYFYPILNFIDNCINLIGLNNEQSIRLAKCNLETAQFECISMQQKYKSICALTQTNIENLGILTQKELHLLEKLADCIMFYTQNTNLGNCSYRYIEKWCQQKRLDTVKNINYLIIKNNHNNIEYIFPNKMLKEKSLNIFPLIAKIDLLSDGEIINVLKNLKAVKDTDIHYVYLLIKNDKEQLNNVGFQILVDSLDEYISGNKQLLPTYTNDNMLGCFSEKIEVFKPQSTEFDGLDSLFIKLWEFSQYSDYLTEDSDKNYLESLQTEKRKDILDYWTEIKHKMQEELSNDIEEMINEVCEKKEKFGDKELNFVVNKLIENSLVQFVE